MKTIAVINQKGGVAKTTTVLNLAHNFASRGKKVIAIDLDPQGNLTLGFDGESEQTIYEFLLGTPMQTVSVAPNIDLIPSNIKLASVEMAIMGELNRERILAKILKPIQNQYDICIIDCPPALSLLTINALATSDYAIIPLKPSTYSYVGLDMMMGFIQNIKDNVNESLSILGIVLTAFDEQKIVARKTLQKLEADDYTHLMFNTSIRTSEKFVRAEENKQSIFQYAPDSNSAKEYHSLVDEIITKIY